VSGVDKESFRSRVHEFPTGSFRLFCFILLGLAALSGTSGHQTLLFFVARISVLRAKRVWSRGSLKVRCKRYLSEM